MQLKTNFSFLDDKITFIRSTPEPKANVCVTDEEQAMTSQRGKP